MVKSSTDKNECCKIDAIVTVDAKGQIVLPKDLRERADVKPNDKLALIGMEKDNAVCCIIMMKADALGVSVKGVLAPMLKETFGETGKSI